jgi:glutathione S-transferase
MTTIKLYGTPLSGHCHRVEMLLRMLDIPHEYIEAASQRPTEEFGKLNPLRQIPVLVDGGLVLSDSNAIMVYLVKRYGAKTSWLSDDAVEAAQIQRWLSIAAGEVRHGPASARMSILWNMKGEMDPVRAHEIAEKLLTVMDAHLVGRDYLATNNPTIADLACYSYIAHAPEGRISLTPYPAVRQWLARIEALPAFHPMPQSAVPAIA